MKQLTLVAAFVSILAMAGMASAQDPVCSIGQHAVVVNGQVHVCSRRDSGTALPFFHG